MFGTFQQSTLRIELDAPVTEIRACLLEPRQFRQWLWPQQFSDGIPAVLTPETTFTSYLGPITIRHQVTDISPQQLRLLMAGGIDGFHEWLWGDGWVQSRLEGISLLPLNLAQTTNLWRLQRFLASSAESRETASET